MKICEILQDFSTLKTPPVTGPITLVKATSATYSAHALPCFQGLHPG